MYALVLVLLLQKYFFRLCYLDKFFKADVCETLHFFRNNWWNFLHFRCWDLMENMTKQIHSCGPGKLFLLIYNYPLLGQDVVLCILFAYF